MQQFKIIHVDDEMFVLDIVSDVTTRHFKNVVVDTFQNGDEAWKTLSHTNPDLLITDLLNDNVPGRKEDFGTSGFHLLARLAEQNINYPILVISGSLTIHKYEAYVMQLFGSRLNLSFIEKPFTTEQLIAELSKYITSASPIPKSEPMALITPQAQVFPLNAVYCPHSLEFQIGGYAGCSHKITHVGNGWLEYRFAAINYEWGKPLDLQPDIERWKQFKKDLDAIGVWSWNPSYETTLGIRDGTYWTLAIKIGEDSVSSTGKNSYPGTDKPDYSPGSSFADLLNAFQSLTGIKDIR